MGGATWFGMSRTRQSRGRRRTRRNPVYAPLPRLSLQTLLVEFGASGNSVSSVPLRSGWLGLRGEIRSSVSEDCVVGGCSHRGRHGLVSVVDQFGFGDRNGENLKLAVPFSGIYQCFSFYSLSYRIAVSQSSLTKNVNIFVTKTVYLSVTKYIYNCD